MLFTLFGAKRGIKAGVYSSFLIPIFKDFANYEPTYDMYNVYVIVEVI